MSMLLQQIRRATYSRRGTAAAITPPHTFSRFYSTNNRALGPEREETSMEFWGKFVLKNGLAISFMYGTYYWVDYDGYRKRREEWEELYEENEKERKAYYEVKKQLDDLRFARP